MSDLLSNYLAAIGKVTLLSAADEVTLGRRVQAMLRIREERPESEWTPRERRTVRSGDRAKRRMVECNLRLVVSCAKKYIQLAKQLELDDLINEGNIGLIRAVEKYDPARGYKFSTYAYWWIRQGVTRAMTQQDRSIRLPCNAITALNNSRKFIYDYKREHGTLPSVELIAEHCDTPVPTMKSYLQHITDCGSLDAKIKRTGSDTDESTILSLIADPSSLVEHDYKLDEQEVAHLCGYIDSFDERTAAIIKRRFGIDGHAEHTLGQIGDIEGISRERVRQIEKFALRKLRMKLHHAPGCLGKTHA